jgi:DNA helicase-4
LLIPVLILLLVAGSSLYVILQQKQKEVDEQWAKDHEEIRKKHYEFYKSRIDNIKNAVSNIRELLQISHGYFAKQQLVNWHNLHANLLYEIKDKPYDWIQLPVDEVNTITQFHDYYSNGDTLRAGFNFLFVAQELNNQLEFFDNIEGRKLDLQQRTAIVTDEDNNIVIAGAGSGKTTTIVAKVKYLINRYKVNPEEILVISYTNKSAKTLSNRLNIPGLEVKTFHKFGLDTISEIEGKQPGIFDENQFERVIRIYFSEQMKKNEYRQLVTEYFTNYLKPPKSQFDFRDQGDYINYLKDQNYRTYREKEIIGHGRITYKMEVVKSIEECKIANFLLFNGINYEYEFPYEFDTADTEFRQYKPDFTIEQNGRKVYLEHFAIARNGDIPVFFAKEGETQEDAKERYWQKINWARASHIKHGTTLIETYSYEMNEYVLFDNLARHLSQAGIVLQPKSPEEIWDIINRVADDEVNSFVSLIGTFITMMKSNNYSIDEIVEKNKKINDSFTRKRNYYFINIIRPIYEHYQKLLTDRREIDFSDMINKASKLILWGKYERKLRYIIIDEFQDISIGRLHLLKAIKAMNRSCKVFAVGDDWQSIYRFTGSDITLFTDFEKQFGCTATSKIETTYRFHNPLIKLSSDFIRRNPNQSEKVLRSTNEIKKTNFRIYYSNSESQDDTLVILEIFNQLIGIYNDIQQKDILILGRYSLDFERLRNGNGIFEIDRENRIVSYTNTKDSGEKVGLKAQFLTVHKAKGLEADIVIILNCNSGKYGFPSEMSDDPVLDLLLSKADHFENGEERRLFYVAMTRAKDCVFFVTDSSCKSKFIEEIELECGISPNKKCPSCKTADIVLRKTGKARNGRSFKFYGCSNYQYGCNYIVTDWLDD